MTEPFDDRFEERLRDALRAEADSTRTSHDALERIQARTGQHRFPWLGLAWMRPAIAVGAAALIAGSVLLGTPQIREHVLPESFVSAADSHKTEPADASAEDTVGQAEQPGYPSDENAAPPVAPSTPSPSASDPAAAEDSAVTTLACPPSDPSPSPEARSQQERDTGAKPTCAPTDGPTEPGPRPPEDPDDGTSPGGGGDTDPDEPTTPDDDPTGSPVDPQVGPAVP